MGCKRRTGICADRTAGFRLNHPRGELKQGQVVKAQVLEIDCGKPRLRRGRADRVALPADLMRLVPEIRSFRIAKLDAAGKRIELELV
jgi:hypothetical protein